MDKVEARGLKFNVSTLGEGEEVVLMIHGLLVDNLSSWYLTAAPALAPHCRLVLYDLRGHGLSDRPKSGYSLDDHVLDAAAILDELGLSETKTTVVGNSFGGRIALAYGVRFPERVKSMVIVDSHPTDTNFADAMRQTRELSDDEREQRLREMFDGWLEEQNKAEGTGKREAVEMKKLVRTFTSRKRRHMARAIWEMAYQTSFIDDVRDSLPPTDEELASLPFPVLALYGEDSHLLSTGEKLRDLIPDCTFEVVPGCAHMIVRHRPDAVRDALVDWVVGLTPARP